MSAATIGAQMPPEITLDDVAAMAAADEHHRYELSREGVLSIMPPASPEHALIVSRLVHWFYLNGYGPEEVTADCGIDVGAGRQPDLTIWAKGKPPAVRGRPMRASTGCCWRSRSSRPTARSSIGSARSRSTPGQV